MSEQQTVLTVEGMHCASCTGRVERALLADPNVISAFVNLSTNRATIRHTDNSGNADHFVGLISQIGFSATTTQRTQNDAAQKRDHETAELKQRLIIGALLALPVVVLAMGPHMFEGFHDLLMNSIGHQTNFYIQWILTTAILLWPGRLFFQHGIPALIRRMPDMNSLVAIGTGAAWGYSTLVTVGAAGGSDVYFEAAAVVVTFILLGRYLEARAKGRTGAAIQSLLELQPEIALVERDDAIIETPFDDLAEGDVLLIKPGTRIPVDGVVISGVSFIDESMITGEPIPVEKAEGASVVSGTLNGTNTLRLRATAVGTETTLSKIIALVEDAQGNKLPIQELVDKVTFYFVPVVLGIATITLLAWLFSEASIGSALLAMVSVLIIACPCAMGLATPTSVIVGSGRAAKDGVLFRKGHALQNLQDASVVAFDKTGTLTEGKPSLAEVILFGALSEHEVLELAASIEQYSEHPVGGAIVKAAKQKGLKLKKPDTFEAVTGMGIAGTISGKQVNVGKAAFVDATPTPEITTLAAQGHTVVFVSVDTEVVAAITVTDKIKPEAKQLIHALHKQDLAIAMITGDAPETANHVAAELGIETVIAGVLPDGKAKAIENLRAQFGPVAFVGDGINDAPALATADTGIAIGSGTDIAIESAEIVTMSGRLNAIERAFEISRATMTNIKQNLFWAFIYNAALIPVAAGVLYPWYGITLSPILASAAMGLSSVFVVTNALRLSQA